MPELVLDRDHRLALRAQAHHLSAIVLLGAAGLTAAALKEIDRALTAHELVKVRAPGDDRDAREDAAAQIADRLDAARIQVIGKVLVFYRPRPPEESEPPARPAPKAAKSRRANRPARSRRQT